MVEKIEYFGERVCPKCHRKLLKNWTALSADEKFIAERQAAGAEFSSKERENHLICTNCWYETKDFSVIT